MTGRSGKDSELPLGDSGSSSSGRASGAKAGRPTTPTPERPASVSPSSAPGRFPLAMQAAEAAREVVMRQRVYPSRVAAGKMTQEECDHQIAVMRAIATTLKMFAEHEGPVRDALVRARAEKDVHDSVREHPAVKAVLEAFPDADLTIQGMDDNSEDET